MNDLPLTLISVSEVYSVIRFYMLHLSVPFVSMLKCIVVIIIASLTEHTSSCNYEYVPACILIGNLVGYLDDSLLSGICTIRHNECSLVLS